MRYILLTGVCVLMATTAHTQQRGYYWDGYRWSCQRDCDRRGPPPNIDEYYRPRGPDLYQEYRNRGGRERYLCYNNRGELVYCYR